MTAARRTAPRSGSRRWTSPSRSPRLRRPPSSRPPVRKENLASPFRSVKRSSSLVSGLDVNMWKWVVFKNSIGSWEANFLGWIYWRYSSSFFSCYFGQDQWKLAGFAVWNGKGRLNFFPKFDYLILVLFGYFLNCLVIFVNSYRCLVLVLFDDFVAGHFCSIIRCGHIGTMQLSFQVYWYFCQSLLDSFRLLDFDIGHFKDKCTCGPSAIQKYWSLQEFSDLITYLLRYQVSMA